MKRIFIIFISVLFSFNVYSALAKNNEMDDSLNRLIDELHELGAQQNPDEIDYIPPLTEEEFNDLVEYSKSLQDSTDSEGHNIVENSNKLSFSEFIEENPTIADGTSLVVIFGWILLFLFGLSGWLLIRKNRSFIGKMILASLVSICLVFLIASNSDLSYYPHAWGLAILIIYGIIFSGIILVYIYGYGSIIFIFHRSESKYRVFGLLLSILCCSLFPPLFLIPIIYYISIRKLYFEECQYLILDKLLPYLSGMYCGLILSIPYCGIVGYLGRLIREFIYYLQYL